MKRLLLSTYLLFCFKKRTGKSDRFLKREIEVLKWLNHKNVIRVFDLIEGKHQFYIAMELAPNGDLLTLLQERIKLPEDEARGIFRSIIDGVLHCHKKGRLITLKQIMIF